jgi:signal transduction histidine kinase
MPTATSAKRASEIWFRVGAPILGLVCVSIIGSLLVFSSLARQQDREFERDSSLLVSSAIDGRVNSVRYSVLDFAFWNDAYRSIVLDWDEEWVASNFVSSAVDGVLLFNEDRVLRYSWLADDVSIGAEGTAQVARASGTTEELRLAASAETHADRTLNRYGVIGDRLVLVSSAPMGWEEDEEERIRGRTLTSTYVACLDFLDAAEVSEIGAALGLEELRFVPVVATEAIPADRVLLPINSGDGILLGHFSWRNERPGANSFARQVGPIVFGLLLLGALAAFVARFLVARQLSAMAEADAALESSRSKSQFIATMSHELRTPLNAIIGYSELIEEEMADDDIDKGRIGEDLSRIRGAGKHLLRLVNDILQHARIDAKSDTVCLEEVKVAGAVSEACDVIKPLAHANGNTLVVSTGVDDTCVSADPKLLMQCLVNLVGNAAKFTKNGSIELRTRRESAGDQDFIAFDVVDTGIGIEPEAMARLFSPFQQANESIAREYGGAGLGLSITRKLARSMGGDVAVTSALGAGSKFTLLLPAALASPARQAA